MTVNDLKIGDTIGNDKIVYLVSYPTPKGNRNYLFIVYQEKLDRFRLTKSTPSQMLFGLKYYHSNFKSALTRVNDIITEEIKTDDYD